MIEVWSQINYGDGKYEVSTLGRVRNTVTGCVISSQMQNSGYLIVHLYSSNRRKAFLVHRLVAIAFIKIIPGKNIVDHIDCNKLNNCLENLRWVDIKENGEYASRNGLFKECAQKARVRMKNIGSKYGFNNSQKYLKQAIPVTLNINGIRTEFRSMRQAAINLKIDDKVLAARIKKGMYQ